ncbi:MAG: hypothetical protein O7D91_15635 [Planctomycetota bacterium]|nr:hypothetical protein [Planctomycetota bacterium]
MIPAVNSSSNRLLRHKRAFASLTGVICLVASGCGTPFQAREKISLTAPLPAQRLLVRTDFGDITVRSDANATEIRAEATLIGKGVTPVEAKKALREIKATLAADEGDSGIVRAEAEHPKGRFTRSYEVRWHVIAPPNIFVDARTSFGDIDVGRFERGLTIKTAFGDIEADAAGPIDLKSNFGDVELYIRAGDIGDVKAVTEFGDVDVRLPMNRAGRLVADTDFGSVGAHIEGMTMRLYRWRSHHFDAQLSGSDTPVIDLATEFGDVDIRAYKAE